MWPTMMRAAGDADAVAYTGTLPGAQGADSSGGAPLLRAPSVTSTTPAMAGRRLRLSIPRMASPMAVTGLVAVRRATQVNWSAVTWFVGGGAAGGTRPALAKGEGGDVESRSRRGRD